MEQAYLANELKITIYVMSHTFSDFTRNAHFIIISSFNVNCISVWINNPIQNALVILIKIVHKASLV